MTQNILCPTKQQLDFLDWELGLFFHFGIRTFFPTHRDWDGKSMPVTAFHPTSLDVEQWVTTAKKAGCRYAILTCKHHDGFCNWPSRFSNYTVAQTPWEHGQGDVVRLFTDACRRHGLRVGLYYSPAQWNADQTQSAQTGQQTEDGSKQANMPKQDGDTATTQSVMTPEECFVAQITELLTQYGSIDYLWFDGCGTEGHVFDKTRIIRTIRNLQPDILLFHLWDPDTRWCGNEEGYCDIDNQNVTDRLPLSMRTPELEELQTTRFLPAECDLKMRDTWFDANNASTIKSPQTLLGLWEYSVGRGANMLINIGPNADGVLPSPDCDALLQFAALRREKWEKPLPFTLCDQNGAPLSQIDPVTPNVQSCDDSTILPKKETTTSSEEPSKNSMFSVEKEKTTSVNCYLLQASHPMPVTGICLWEDLQKGQRISSFRIEIQTENGRNICIYESKSIGHRRACLFPLVVTDRFLIFTQGALGQTLRNAQAYCFSKDNDLTLSDNTGSEK